VISLQLDELVERSEDIFPVGQFLHVTAATLLLSWYLPAAHDLQGVVELTK
jgi:hypothetical protein